MVHASQSWPATWCTRTAFAIEEPSVNERPRDKKPPSPDYLSAFGFVVLVITVLYAVWTAG